ncbi:hypothetical protein CY35_05G014100 [Sphagnum magellanicum]|nr:hypothetical protein CY35_05G014100 [Sphagnum magellanicum]
MCVRRIYRYTICLPSTCTMAKRSVSLEGSSTGVMSVSPSGWSPGNTMKMINQLSISLGIHLYVHHRLLAGGCCI